MTDKRRLRTALEQLDNNEKFDFVADGADWKLFVKDVEVCALSAQQKTYICRTGANALEELKLALRYLLLTPSEPRNLDAATAEIIMGWTREADQPGCECLTYRSGNGAVHHVAKSPENGCKSHTVWTPSRNLQHTQDLFEKVFPCVDGRFLAITNIGANFQAVPKQPGVIEVTDLVKGRTVITFRNAARTETFEVVDEQSVPPAGACIAALKQIGINVVYN
jgi:hypothetical protein